MLDVVAAFGMYEAPALYAECGRYLAPIQGLEHQGVICCSHVAPVLEPAILGENSGSFFCQHFESFANVAPVNPPQSQ